MAFNLQLTPTTKATLHSFDIYLNPLIKKKSKTEYCAGTQTSRA